MRKREKPDAESKNNSEKYRLLFEAAPVGIGIADLEGNVLDANPSIQKMMGFTLEELKSVGVGATYAEPEERMALLKDVMENGSVRDREVRLKHRDGTIYTGLLNVDLVELGGRKLLLTTARDITDRKQTEQKLREGERFLANIFESIQDGIGIIDKNMNIIRTNPTAERWYPHNMPLAGKKCYEAYHNRSEPCEVCPAIKTLRTGESAHEVVLKTGSRGENIGWVEIYSFPMIDSGTGQMGGVIEYVRDITERKRIEEALRLYSNAVEEAPDGVQIIDLNGHIIYSNRAVERMYGFSREELRRRHVNEMNVDPNFAADIIIPCIKKHGSWAGELMVKHRNGREFPIWLNTSLVKNSRGEPIAMVGIIRDMTERRGFEETLRESEERYRNLFEDSPISLWEEDSSDIKNYIDELKSKGVEDFREYFETHPEEVIRCTGMVKVVNVNNAAVSLFRALGKKELMDGLGQIFTEHSYVLFKEELIAIAQGKTEFEGEDVLKTFAGNVINVYLKWSLTPGHESDYSKRHVSMIDITERKSAEEAIKKYAGELEESNYVKELFIDIMHHDLIDLLATAGGFVELMKESETQARKRGYIETVERSLARATELIDSVTKFPRIENLESLEFSNMNLKGIIEDVIEDLRPSAAKAGIDIENNVTRSMPIRANKIIKEVFASLISSVIIYTPGRKRIIVNSEEGDIFWKIRIIDRQGLMDTDKAMIFGMLCGMEKKGVKGSGLGLAIARRIVRLHKGGIGLENTPDGGTVFIVELPKLEYLYQHQ